MTATTPNFAIPYPEITDFVKDGAAAMEAIAEKVDDSLYAATMGRNRLINGDFRVAQRGTSFVAGANNDDSYNLDRWYVLSDGNDIVDITQSTTSPPTGGKYSIGLDVETANRKFGIAQIVENLNCLDVQNKACTLSFKARRTGSSINNVKAVILAWTGTADTVTSDVVSAWNVEGTTPTWIANVTAENTPANLNVTTDWATYTITATVDTASVNNIIVFIWSDDTTTTVGDFLYLTDIQFEVGAVPTPFERRQIQQELDLCLRYYQRIGGEVVADVILNGYVPASAQLQAFIVFPVFLRTSPSLSQRVGIWTVTNSCGQVTIGSSGSKGAYIFAQANAGISNAFQSNVYTNSTGHYLEFGAEL